MSSISNPLQLRADRPLEPERYDIATEDVEAHED
jgi:hypothetical protein